MATLVTPAEKTEKTEKQVPPMPEEKADRKQRPRVDEKFKIFSGTANEPLARKLLSTAWSNPEFISSYAGWTVDILEQQRHYHFRIASKQQALRHRVHNVNTTLFALTALGALLHLVLHTLWLSLVTTFFPALGASLHGALAQSEAYRLGTTSARLVGELQGAIDRIRAASQERDAGGDVLALKAAIEAAIALILEEHQDWHLLVRPHNLPLA